MLHFKNDRGIALIMALLMLVVVGGLTAVLLDYGIFNIVFSRDEVEENKAFYAAEAGIQYLKSESNEINFDDKTSSNLSLDEKFYLDDNKDISFTVSEINREAETIYFKSIGNYNGLDQEITRKIKIEYIMGGSSKNFQIQHGGDPLEVLRGAKAIDLWNEGDGEVFIDPNITPQKSFWFNEYVDKFYEMHDPESDFETEYLKYDFLGRNSFYEKGPGQSGTTVNSEFEDDYQNFYNTLSIDTEGNLKLKDETEKGSEREYESKQHFIAYVGNEEVDEIANLTINQDLYNTILVVDGDVSISSNTKIGNSIIVATGDLHFRGVPNHDIFDSLFFIYQHELEYEPDLLVSGEGSDDWVYTLPSLDDAFDDQDLIGLLSNPSFVDWRPTR